jgi:hypothetical protein
VSKNEGRVAPVTCAGTPTVFPNANGVPIGSRCVLQNAIHTFRNGVFMQPVLSFMAFGKVHFITGQFDVNHNFDKFLKKIHTLEKFHSLGCRTVSQTDRQLERTEMFSIKAFHF